MHHEQSMLCWSCCWYPHHAPSAVPYAGGHAIGGRTNDLFLLDLSAWQWSQPATAGTAPSPRQVGVGASHLLIQALW
jgi:hypothetical protein